MINAVEKLPPQNIDAEQSVLGSLMIERDAIAKIVEILHPGDFYKDSHQIIFSAIMALFEKGEPVDLVTLTEELRKKGSLENSGGVAYLTSLLNAVPTAANVEYYANIIKEKSIMRSLIYAGTSIATMGYDEKENVDRALDRSEELVFGIAQKRITRDFIALKGVLTSTFQKIEELYERKAHVTGVPSGFREFDLLTAGFQPSDFVIIAARPSLGKTSFCLNIAQYVAIHEKLPVAIFSLEMSREQLAQRLLCSEAGINAQRLRTGHLEESDWPKISRAMAVLSEAPIYIDDSPGLTVLEMRSKARRLKMKYGLEVLIIDYLQLIKGSGRSENRNQEISEISRQMKSLAKELNIPVIALSQLSREVEKRTDKRPQLSDLRESGAIEQEADVVSFIYREDYYFPNTDRRNIADINIAKQRNGPVGNVELIFLKEYTKFVSQEKYRE
ncbi:MAG: replicative DNA helicase [Firmicutes bacterium]|nr:replicative DNA helicase [Bacillota bacterium]